LEPVIHPVGGQGLPLCFAHANGYPPGSYRRLFEALMDRFEITALEHRPLWGERQPPQRLSWKLFADDMLAALRQRYDDPVWLMGHSMGATVATLAAVREPQRFAGLILMDPVFLPDRFIVSTRLMPARQRRKLPMLRRALGRPHHFSDYDAAFAFYRGKRAFRRLSDEALRDYVLASKVPDGEGGVALRYSGEWEAAVYGSPPRVCGALKRLRVATIGLRGRDSDTLRPEIFARWAHWQPGASLREVPGGHLFPLEHPLETAGAIREQLFAE
jgi:pimeloyl-ACP methyl ester carboxylesterase